MMQDWADYAAGYGPGCGPDLAHVVWMLGAMVTRMRQLIDGAPS